LDWEKKEEKYRKKRKTVRHQSVKYGVKYLYQHKHNVPKPHKKSSKPQREFRTEKEKIKSKLKRYASCHLQYNFISIFP